MTLADCIAAATGELVLGGQAQVAEAGSKKGAAVESSHAAEAARADGAFSARGAGLTSQEDFVVRGEAFVSEAPVTFLGYVNRQSGVIEEAGHPRDGQSMAGKIAIFPKGSGSSVAPNVLLELFYRGKAPLAILNTDIDQQTAPACSLEGIPYGFNFDKDIIANINDGDLVELRREGESITITVSERVS
jgi:predicted aconitase with swiveling domain